MGDLKAFLNQIETVDDYFKFKDKISKPQALQGSKPLASLADFYPEGKAKKGSEPGFLKENLPQMDLSSSHYLGDSGANFLKENMTPRELKEDKNMNRLSRVGEIKVFGNETTNESMVENSFLKQLNIKKAFNVKNMFEVERPNQGEQVPMKYAVKVGSGGREGLKVAGYGLTNSMGKGPVTHFDYGSSIGSSKNFRGTTGLTGSSNGLYNKFQAPDRPDSKGTYIDNNDIRAYLSSLDNRLETSEARSSASKRSASASQKPSKGKGKARKMELSIIEDDMEGEETENKNPEERKKRAKKARNKKEADFEGSEEEEKLSNYRAKKKPSRSIYEEDLTRNLSEKDLSLYSASHFNNNYQKKPAEYSEKSQVSKGKDQSYLRRKYGKDLPSEDKILEFLDNISEIVCMNCGELVDLNRVDEHSLDCFKASKAPNNESLSSINKQLRQISSLLRKKLKNIKEYINKHEDSEHFYFNYTLMIIECVNQIIQNDQNIISLVSNIKDITAFNKSLSDNNTPLAKFILSITYRVKPMAKLKIPCIDPQMTWESAKNLREKSICNQSFKSSNNLKVRDSHRSQNTSSLRESVLGASRFLSNQMVTNPNNASMILQEADPLKREFMQIVVEAKLNLERHHPGRNYKADELFNEVKRSRVGKERWREWVETRFNEIGRSLD